MPKIPSPKDSDNDDRKSGYGRTKPHPDHQHNEGLIQIGLKIMSALENLTAAIARLQISVDAAVTDILTPHPTDAQVQVAADAVNAQSDRLDQAVTPPVEPPPTA